MNKFTQLATLAIALTAGRAVVAQQINEIYASHTGTDDMEFIELKGTANMKLDGFMVLIVEGDGASAGTLDRAWDLKGQVIPANGYFVMGDDNVPAVDMKIGASNRIENGTMTVYLVKSADPAKITALLGKKVDVNSGTTTTIPTLSKIIDVIAMVDGGISSADKTYDGAKRIGPDGTFLPAGIYRAVDVLWCAKGFLDFDDVANKNAPSTAGALNTILCAPATVAVIGKSCLTGAGTAGGPDLTASKPSIGKSFDSKVSNASANSAGFVFGGVAASATPFLRCSIHLNVAALINLGALTFTSTTGELKLPLPYSASLLGNKFAIQAAVTSGTALHLTNGLSGTIGY